MGIMVERQKRLFVYYKNNIAGVYSAELIIENVVLCELKAHEQLFSEAEYQLVNYLKASTIEIGLLLNFGEKPELKRKVYDND